MKSEKMKRKARKIHLGDGKYLDSRVIFMRWYGGSRSRSPYDDDDDEDELETLARLQFKVKAPEYAIMAKLGLVDTDAAAEDSDKESKIILRTDSDLVDEAEDTLRDEWENSLSDPTCPLAIWTDLDYWEVESIG